MLDEWKREKKKKKKIGRGRQESDAEGEITAGGSWEGDLSNPI